MKQLFNYCSLPMYEADLSDVQQNLQSFLKEFELSGIEQRVYQPLGQVPVQGSDARSTFKLLAGMDEFFLRQSKVA